MTKPEWTPVNPCENCADGRKGKDCKDYYDCTDKALSDGEISGQKKLLDYLIVNPEGTFPYTYIKQLESMRKQLEAI